MDEMVPDSAQCPVLLQAKALKAMVGLVKALYRLHKMAPYQEQLTNQLPGSAAFDPGHDAVMMGYDFHLSPQGPRLIEVNTNAGGLMLAWQAHQSFSTHQANQNNRHLQALLASFYNEMALFSSGSKKRPQRVVIIDQKPEEQFLYPEMQQFALLLNSRGIKADIADPSQLQVDEKGVFLHGEACDFIYNRHCDFYMESEILAPIRAAYLAKKVCVSPNPRAYGLLADKRRMLLWSNAAVLDGWNVPEEMQKKLLTTIPACRLLADIDPEEFWQQRQQWVLKPVDSFGSRGVTMGKGISRTRFLSLDPQTTLLQKLIPATTTTCPWGGKPYKTDFRLFVYQEKILGVTARIYRGQVTSFKEPGSGYAPVKVVWNEK